jgi:hypothetical protein
LRGAPELRSSFSGTSLKNSVTKSANEDNWKMVHDLSVKVFLNDSNFVGLKENCFSNQSFLRPRREELVPSLFYSCCSDLLIDNGTFIQNWQSI